MVHMSHPSTMQPFLIQVYGGAAKCTGDTLRIRKSSFPFIISIIASNCGSAFSSQGNIQTWRDFCHLSAHKRSTWNYCHIHHGYILYLSSWCFLYNRDRGVDASKMCISSIENISDVILSQGKYICDGHPKFVYDFSHTTNFVLEKDWSDQGKSLPCHFYIYNPARAGTCNRKKQDQ